MVCLCLSVCHVHSKSHGSGLWSRRGRGTAPIPPPLQAGAVSRPNTITMLSGHCFKWILFFSLTFRVTIDCLMICCCYLFIFSAWVERGYLFVYNYMWNGEILSTVIDMFRESFWVRRWTNYYNLAFISRYWTLSHLAKLHKILFTCSTCTVVVHVR